MKDKAKIILALKQVENIASLIEGNEYEQYMVGKLISIKVELERQLTNLSVHSRI
jgi:hypothetical protein